MMQAGKPEILAPAGDAQSFLAALSAGADAIYVGLKHFSARMLAKNFSTSDLAALAELARGRGVKTYVALNTLIKPDELDRVGRLMARLAKNVGPDAIIMQDPAVFELARQAGFEGELHVSTLANVSHQSQLAVMQKLGAHRVVLPRELSVDEIREMAAACPEGLSLETFVHGALCHNVSGRCYWSSFLGGKSGLRGRCVQPCRRVYEHKGKPGRFFSCLDLSLDVLCKALLTIPEVSAWKIEGRKKGPHYVYYTVSAYKTLRDNPEDSKAKKAAVEYLEQALGRPGVNYNFLPQRPKNPVDHRNRTGSGLVAGKLGRAGGGGHHISARVDLIPGDLLRVGYEDDEWHKIVRVSRAVPKGGRLSVKFERGGRPESGAQVFLIDRREPDMVKRIGVLEKELEAIPRKEGSRPEFKARLPKSLPRRRRSESRIVDVWRHPHLRDVRGTIGVWISTNRAHNLPMNRARSVWWWTPPVIWPDEESEFQRLVDLIIKRGGVNFILNAPWQIGMFPKRKKLNLWAGPFCNISNALAMSALKRLGFNGVVASPELSGGDMAALGRQSPLSVGAVIKGFWPLGVSRMVSPEVKTCTPLVSPKGEACWAVRYDQNYYIYPNWRVDLFNMRGDMVRAGYELFVSLREPLPKTVPEKDRDCVFNWKVGLL